MMKPYKPEDWPHVFQQHINAGDLDAAIALYEPDAQFISPSGETLVGRDQMRKVLGSLIEAKTRFTRNQVIKVVTVGDIAQLYTDFEGTMVDGSGNTIPMESRAIEILRRNQDGSWGLIVGDPNGRQC